MYLQPHGLPGDSWEAAPVYMIDGHEIMKAGRGFVDAYGHRLERSEVLKITSNLEVNIVMHILAKKTSTRVTYDNLVQIAAAMHAEFKSKDDKVPSWPVWRNLEAKTIIEQSRPARG